jgi:hypothetical protein
MRPTNERLLGDLEPSDQVWDGEIERVIRDLLFRHSAEMESTGRNPVDYTSPLRRAAQLLQIWRNERALITSEIARLRKIEEAARSLMSDRGSGMKVDALVALLVEDEE